MHTVTTAGPVSQIFSVGKASNLNVKKKNTGFIRFPVLTAFEAMGWEIRQGQNMIHDW